MAARSGQGTKTKKKQLEVVKESARELRVNVPPDLQAMSAKPSEELKEGRYVYGVIEIDEPASFGKTSMGGSNENVYTIHHKDLAAVVSNTTIFIYDPTRENALAHEHVIENVMKAHTIIPMSFGTVFRTEQDVKEVLKSIYPSLKD